MAGIEDLVEIFRGENVKLNPFRKRSSSLMNKTNIWKAGKFITDKAWEAASYARKFPAIIKSAKVPKSTWTAAKTLFDKTHFVQPTTSLQTYGLLNHADKNKLKVNILKTIGVNLKNLSPLAVQGLNVLTSLPVATIAMVLKSTPANADEATMKLEDFAKLAQEEKAEAKSTITDRKVTSFKGPVIDKALPKEEKKEKEMMAAGGNVPSTDIKDYWRRAWGIGDRPKFKPGGIVEPGVVNYGKATMDDPLHNIKKGEELGKSVKQIVSKKNKVIGYQAFTKEPYYISNTEKNAFQRVKDYVNEFRSPMAGTLKKGITKYTASAMFQDSDFEEFFKKYLNKGEGYVKDFKGNADKLSLDDLKKEWNKILPTTRKDIVRSPWNRFKSRTKVSFLSEIAEHLPYSEVTLKNYLSDAKMTLPKNITENLAKFYKITSGKKIVDQLKELDLLPENYETAKSGEKYTWKKLTDADKEKLKNVKRTISLDPNPAKRSVVSAAAKAELLPEQRSINVARRALITETNKQLKDLLKTKPHQLRLFIANNPVIKEIVETEIRDGDLSRTPINTLTDKELYERVRVTEDHVKDFNKTKIDAYGKVLSGQGIENPENLRIMLRQQNHPLKRIGAEFVERNINSKDPKIKNQIKNIENFFRRTGQAFLTGEFETGTIKGATGNISLEKQFKNLGLDVTEILDASGNEKLKAKINKFLNVKDQTKLSSTIQSIINKKNSGLNVADIAKWGSAELSALDDIAGKLPSKALSVLGKLLKTAGIAAIPLDFIPYAQEIDRGMGIRSVDTGTARLLEDFANMPKYVSQLAGMLLKKDWDLPYEMKFGRRYADWVAEGIPLEQRIKNIEKLALDEKYRDDILYSASGEADMIGDVDVKKLKEEAEVPLLPEKGELEIKETDNIFGTEVPTKNLTGVDIYKFNRGI